MEYTNENRGQIQYHNRIKQVIDFTGLRIGTITPTDIDGYVDYHNKAAIVFEYKHKSATLSEGQRIALERIINNFQRAGKIAALFLCRHNQPPWEDIKGADAIVERIYFQGHWYPGKGLTAKQQEEKFIAWADSVS